MRRKLPVGTRLVLWQTLLFLLLFTVVRVVFFLFYRGLMTDGEPGDILKSFLLGFRFDLATAAILLLPLALLAHIPSNGRTGRTCRLAAACLGVVLFIVVAVLSLGDCVYYAHGAKRMTLELLTVGPMVKGVLSLAFTEHPVFVPMTFLSLGLLLLGGCMAFAAYVRRAEPTAPARRWPMAAAGLATIVIGIILVRGGLQGLPLRPSDAYFSKSIVISHMTLNPVYTFIRSYKDEKGYHKFMPDTEAVSIVRGLLASPNERFVSDEYPVLRELKKDGPPKPYNVVILFMESLDAEAMGFLGNTVGATPNMDKMAAEAVVFDRFFTEGTRSINGIFSSFFSIPDQLGHPVLETSLIQHNFSPLSTILGRHGYESVLVCGPMNTFRQGIGLFSRSGYDRSVSEPAPGLPARPRTQWGYDDDIMFPTLLAELDKPHEKPWCVAMYTMNLHGTELPAGVDKHFPDSIENAGYYNVLYYTDACLGKFFDEARKRPWFNNTIFVMYADHTHHGNPRPFENFHIPLVLYAPAILTPARISTIGSHVDIVPTVLGLLNLSTTYASFGRDLLLPPQAGEEGFAYLAIGDCTGWVEGPWLLMDFFKGSEPRLYNYKDDPNITQNVAGAHPDVVKNMIQKSRAYLQTSRRLLLDNRITDKPNPPKPGVQ